MASNITFNGVTYSIPAVGDDGWGSDLSAYFIAIASGALQKTGGNFTLTAEANFGATFGLKSAYFKSQATNPASAGIVRLGNNESISWRNNANNADINLKVNASDSLEFNGASILYGLILNANVDPAAAIALSKLATVTASRVLVSDVSGIITASAITTTTLAFLDATSSIQTQLDAKASSASLTSHTSATTSVHGIADTSLLITTTGAQVLTNKDYDGGTASNTSRFTIPKASKATLDALTRKEATLVYASDTDKMYYDDGSILKLVGSGSGGAVNFISDGDAEGANIWTAYADAAGTRPVDGTGGSPTVTATISSTSPLAGTNSFLLTKGASNTQGQGIATTFSVDLAYRAKVLQIEFDYILSSGTFTAGSSSADSDVIAYIYDVTNSTLIEPSSIKLLSNSTTLGDKFVANFQSSATGSSYRLILHCATTSASAYTLKLDNFRVGPSNYVYGTPITDWQSYSLTIGGSTSAPTVGTNTNRAIWRRVGDSMEIKYYLNQTGAGAAGSGTYLFPLPSGSTIDTNKVTVTTNGSGLGGTALGAATAGNTTSGAANNATVGTVIAYNSTNLAVQLLATTIGQTITLGSTNYALSGATILYQFEASVPISGWSSSTQVSDGYDGRLIAAQATTASQTITAGGTRQIVNGSTVTYDKTGSITTGASWKFTAPSQGIYEVKYVSSHSFATYTTGAEIGAELYKNGSFAKPICNFMQQAATGVIAMISGSVEVELNANDYIDVREFIGGSVNSTINGATIYISKKQAPTTISATELIAAGYSLSANKTPAANAAIDFDSKLYDTHNAVTTGGSGVWKFTAPASGIYEVNMTGALTSGSQTVDLYKNGVQGKALMSVSTSVTSGSASVSLNAGDYISANPDGSVTFSSTKNTNIYIKRLK